MGTPMFLLGKPIDLEESMTCEFKEVKGQAAVKAIGKVIDEYAVGFLNAKGGSVYWGIRDNDRCVVGVRLNSKMRDEVLQVAGQKIATIAPPILPDEYEFPFHPVLSPGKHSVVEDTFVVELSVRTKTPGVLYLTGGGEAYRRTLGGVKKLSGAELLAALMGQLEQKLKVIAEHEPKEHPELAWMPSVARRARVVRSLIDKARILWVDDNPSNNLYERTILASLGVSTDLALSTDEAIYMADRLKYDLILSDMKRGENPAAGIELLKILAGRTPIPPVVFYVGRADPNRGIPVGAFGITNRPDELLHYVFDVLERRGI